MRSDLPFHLVAALFCFFAVAWQLRRAQPPSAPEAVEMPALCVARRGAVLVAVACADPSGAAWWYGPEERAALGLPLCWWTADVAALDALHGVGPGVARSAIAHRDAGGAPDRDALAALPGLSELAAIRLAAAVTVACAR